MQDQTIKPLKLLAEGVAIVVSILLAFSIDAWWEERRERDAEADALTRLRIEFDENLKQLASNREQHEDALRATEQLLALTGPQPMVSDLSEIGALLDECLSNATYDPRLGTINSLIASGQLQLIEDKKLQAMLTDWPVAVQDLLNWQVIELENAEHILLPFTYDYVAWPDIDVDLGLSGRPSNFDSDFIGLFSSLRFEGMLDNRRYNLRHLISEIQELEAKTDEIVDRLEMHVNDK